MSKPAKISVLLVDDHPVVRMGLRLIGDLDPGIKVVGEAATGKEALTEARRLQPDVVLLDYRLPDAGGHEICRQLKSVLPEVHVLFLSSYAADTTTTAALEAGADGYLLKENDAQKIVDAIHCICRGGMVIDPAIARAAIAHSSGTAGPAAQIVAQLSEQERRVLAELATGKADKDIALSLGLEAKTVRNYLVQVYRKLNVHSRTQAALLYQQATHKAHPD
jgi:two-component system, NarL family, response regulator DevR